jgi:transcription antitermination protein NusB
MRLTRAEQRMRRRARARALQAVYAWDANGREGIAAATGRLWDDLALGTEEREFATPLIRTLEARGSEIDEALGGVTTNWRLERLGGIERAVLRLAAAELLRSETPVRVVIQEAVLLAERFGSEESARFVNGIVDALARKMGRI